MIFLVTVYLLVVLPLAFCGYGWFVTRLLRQPVPRPEWALVLGVATTVVIGGILNALSLATQHVIWGVVVGGAGGGVAYFFNRPGKIAFLQKIEVSGLIVTAIGFAASTQLRPSVYNFGDDFMKYFTHPVRMLQTGTVFGSPLSAIGSETLGGQAMLHSLLLCVFPIEYINGVDAVLGLAVCLVLASRLVRGRRFWGRLTALLLLAGVVLIDPQYVNVSSLYFGAALVMAAIALGLPKKRNTLLLALVYAALLAMKSTFAVFVAVHFLGLVIADLVSDEGGGLKKVVAISGGTLLFVLPWIFVHLPSYLAAGLPRAVLDLDEIPDVTLFSRQPLQYGGSMFAYTSVVLALLFSAAVSFAAKDQVDGQRKRLLMAASSVAACYGIVFYALGPLSGYSFAVRFFTPFLIGAFPILAWSGWQRASTSRTAQIAVAITLLASTATFLMGCCGRYAWAAKNHTILPSWARKPSYINYNQFVLSAEARRVVQYAQSRVPEGEPIVAWILYPFYLDYRRNEIYDLEFAGLTTPWAAPPRARYMIWDRREPVSQTEKALEIDAVKTPGIRERLVKKRALSALQFYSALVRQGRYIDRRDTLWVHEIPLTDATFAGGAKD